MRNLTVLVALPITLLLFGLSVIPVCNASVWLADLNIGTCFPRVCAGPKNAVYVVWKDKKPTVSEDAPDSIFFRRSMDGGASFEGVLEIENDITPDIIVTNPQIVVDSAGTVYVVYSKYDLKNNQFILIVQKKEGNGAGFIKNTVYTEELEGFFREDNFAFFGSDLRILEDKIYYAWSGTREVFLAIIENGETSEVFDVEHAGNEDEHAPSLSIKIYPSIGIDSNHNVHIAWFEAHHEDGAIEIPYHVYTSKKNNDQGQFSNIIMVGKLGVTGQLMGRPAIVPDSENKVLIAFNAMDDCQTVFSEDGGISYSEPTTTSFGIQSSAYLHKTISDQNKNMHFLYISKIDTTLYFSSSPDAGRSVASTVKVASPITAEADMNWSEDNQLAYIVRVDPRDDTLYFSKSSDASASEEPGSVPDQSTAGGSTSDGGGGGGCFIGTIFNQ